VEDEYCRITLYICMKIEQWNPPKTVEKEEREERVIKIEEYS
jgi:hypothetical protein